MNELVTKTEKETITSLELLEKINELREKEYNYKIENGLELGKVEKRNGKYTRLEHNGFLKIIRDEFSEEISLGKISQSKYINSRGKEYDNFILTFNQSRQLLTRESKFVRKAVIEYIDYLENQNRQLEELARIQARELSKVTRNIETLKH